MARRKLKLMVIGHARHGKDAVCFILQRKYGMSFVSSSRFVLEKAVWPALCCEYETMDHAFDDRHNRRAQWFDLIAAYNRPNPARLGTELFAAHDIYCGLRSAREFHALKIAGVFDFAIWIDASERHPPEPRSSCTVEAWMADYVLDNNGTLAELEGGIDRLMAALWRRVSPRRGKAKSAAERVFAQIGPGSDNGRHAKGPTTSARARTLLDTRPSARKATGTSRHPV